MCQEGARLGTKRVPRPDPRYDFLRHFRNPFLLPIILGASALCGHLYFNYYVPSRNPEKLREKRNNALASHPRMQSSTSYQRHRDSKGGS